jgi:hypothetical protein
MRRPTRRLASTPSNLASIMPRAIVAGDSDDRDIDSTQRVLGCWHVGLSALHSRPATGAAAQSDLTSRTTGEA